MTQAEVFKNWVEDYTDSKPTPKQMPVWVRYYGPCGYDRRGGRIHNAMYQGFPDGSRLVTYREDRPRRVLPPSA